MSHSATSTTSFLLVEDDPTIAFATQRLLKMKLKDIEIDSVDTGQMAKVCIRKKSYDIILLDLRLPDMYGSDLAIYAKTSVESRCGDSRIVVLSAHQTADTFDHKQFRYIERFITKPLTVQWIEKLFGYLATQS